MSVLLRVPEMPRDSAARGEESIDVRRIRSEIPCASRSSTARVASGVTSRSLRPVPPVVSTRSALVGVAPVDVSVDDLRRVVGHEGARRDVVAAGYCPCLDRCVTGRVSALAAGTPASEIVRIAIASLTRCDASM